NYIGGERAASPLFYVNDDGGIDGAFDITAEDLEIWRSTGEFTYTTVDCDGFDFDDEEFYSYGDRPILNTSKDGDGVNYAYKYDGKGTITKLAESSGGLYATYDGWTWEYDLAGNVTATYYGDGDEVQITKKISHDGSGVQAVGTQNEKYLAYVYYSTGSSVEHGYNNYDLIVEGLTRDGELEEIYSGTHIKHAVRVGENFLYILASTANVDRKDLTDTGDKEEYVYLTETGETMKINWAADRPSEVRIHEVHGNKAVIEAKDSEGNSLGYMLIPLESTTVIEDIENYDTYKFIGSTDGEIYLVQTNDDKWGYINADGDLLAIYDDAGDFMGKYAPVVKDGKAFLINRNFKRVSEKIDAEGVSTIDKGLYRVNINGEKYFMTYAAAQEESAETADKPEEPEQPAEPADPAETTEPTDTESAAESPAQDVPDSDDGDKTNPDTGVGFVGIALAIAAVGVGSVVLIRKRR
ncbi:MAG: WG repeat-containing protein, partial [Oscillospiraceae bacterium]